MKNNTKNNTKTAETKAKVATKTTEVKPVTAEKPIAPVAPKTETAKTTETAKPAETKTEYKPQKRESASSRAMKLFQPAIDNKKITKEIEEKLTDKQYCKEQFKLSYPLLLKVEKDKDVKEQRKINGYYRYQSTTVKINGTEYFVTNNWYDKQVEAMRVLMSQF